MLDSWQNEAPLFSNILPFKKDAFLFFSRSLADHPYQDRQHLHTTIAIGSKVNSGTSCTLC